MKSGKGDKRKTELSMTCWRFQEGFDGGLGEREEEAGGIYGLKK